MPGVVPCEILRESVIDSWCPTYGSLVRLRARQLPRPVNAHRFRLAESRYLREEFKDIFKLLLPLTLSHGAVVSGNQFVYQAMNHLIYGVMDPEYLKNSPSNMGLDLVALAQDQFILKLGRTESAQISAAVQSLSAHEIRRYVLVRDLIQQLSSAKSHFTGWRSICSSASSKGVLPSEDWEKFYLDTVSEYTGIRDQDSDEFSSRMRSLYEYSCVLNTGDHLRVVKVQDVTVLLMSGMCLPMTDTHFERLQNFLRRFVTGRLGLGIAYGLQDQTQGAGAMSLYTILCRKLCKYGVKDPFSAGEGGKAGADLYKAFLSQTRELPFNNVSALRSTYTDKRAEIADDFYQELRDSDLDIDVVLNVSFAWKNALQPDPSFQSDFTDLMEALGKPNPVDEGAPDLIACSIKRAVLIGSLSSRRQPTVTPYEGKSVPPFVSAAIKKNSPVESDFRKITLGDMSNIKVNVPEVFPNIRDLSRIKFRDKASTIPRPKTEQSLNRMNHLRSLISEEEDKIMDIRSLELANEALMRLSKDPDNFDIHESLRMSANDILSTLDRSVYDVFSEGERKFKAVIKSFEKVREAYETDDFFDRLKEWAKENSELIVHTGIEPKYGEVHKRVARIFYMFELELKVFVSQFEKISKTLCSFIKGAEITKSDISREKHINLLSMAHQATGRGTAAYAILFDLSKFSQKFNHKVIDAAARVVGELVDYPEFEHLSDLFKASLILICGRGQYRAQMGVQGCFEGFLNFLWTAIHASIMDLSLKATGRYGDLAAYSDDGLLLFLLAIASEDLLKDDVSHITKELEAIIRAIQSSYASFGLDFNLGKTLLSRTFSEFLGILSYKGKRMPTWLKELVKLGEPEERQLVNPISGKVRDSTSQMAACVKAAMPAAAAVFMGCLESVYCVGHRLHQIGKGIIAQRPEWGGHQRLHRALMAYFTLSNEWGGARIPDLHSLRVNADADPLDELLYEVETLVGEDNRYSYLNDLIWESIQSTRDYSTLIGGSFSVPTGRLYHGPSTVRGWIAKYVQRKYGTEMTNPLSLESCPAFHRMIELYDNVDPSIISSLAQCSIKYVEFRQREAPERTTVVAKIVPRNLRRSFQRKDTKRVQEFLYEHLRLCNDDWKTNSLNVKSLLKRAFPSLNITSVIPSYRRLFTLSTKNPTCGYSMNINPVWTADRSGKSNRLSCSYYVEQMAPPLITSEPASETVGSSPDLLSACTRRLFTLLTNSSSRGCNILSLCQLISHLNGGKFTAFHLQSKLQDLRKLVVCNRKKSIHRVYGSAPVKSALTMMRMGTLHQFMSARTDFHYSMSISVALGLVTTLDECIPAKSSHRHYMLELDQQSAESLHLLPMRPGSDGPLLESLRITGQERVRSQPLPKAVEEAIKYESNAYADECLTEIRENTLAGRFSMVADIEGLNDPDGLFSSLKAGMIRSVSRRISSITYRSSAPTGVVELKAINQDMANVPVDVVRYASIISLYSQAHISAIVGWVKGKSESCGLDESRADLVISAAESLGLNHPFSRNGDRSCLLSVENAKVFIAIKSGQVAGLANVLPALRSESKTSPTLSKSRAQAVKMNLQALLSELFSEEEFTPQLDVDKLFLKVLLPLIRSSVHRSTPYNVRVAVQWITVFRLAAFHIDDSQGDRDINDTVRRIADEVNPIWGSVHEQREAITFLIQLKKYGSLSGIRKSLEDFEPLNIQTYLWETYVKPSCVTCQVVSYGGVSKAVNSYEGLSGYLEEGYEAYDDIIKEFNENSGGLELLQFLQFFEPRGRYRSQDKPGCLEDYSIRSTGQSELLVQDLLKYSVVLPGLLAMGYTGFSDIFSQSPDHSSRLRELIFSQSLPYDDRLGNPKLVIVRSAGEGLLQSELRSLDARTGDIIVFEVPPFASLWSIALLNYLSDGYELFCSMGISSDLKGFSLYACFKYKEGMFDIMEKSAPQAVDPKREYLADAILSPALGKGKDSDLSLISSVTSECLLSAGFTVNFYMKQKEEDLPVQVTSVEELLDKNFVSFVEMPRNIAASALIAAEPEQKLFHFLRACRIEGSKCDPSYKIIWATSHVIAGYRPDLSLESIHTEVLRGVTLHTDPRIWRNFLNITSAIRSFGPFSNPSAAPPSAQMREAQEPINPPDRWSCDMYVKDSIDLYAKRREGANELRQGSEGYAMIRDFLARKEGYPTLDDLLCNLRSYQDEAMKEVVEMGSELPSLDAAFTLDENPYLKAYSEIKRFQLLEDLAIVDTGDDVSEIPDFDDQAFLDRVRRIFRELGVPSGADDNPILSLVYEEIDSHDSLSSQVSDDQLKNIIITVCQELSVPMLNLGVEEEKGGVSSRLM